MYLKSLAAFVNQRSWVLEAGGYSENVSSCAGLDTHPLDARNRSSSGPDLHGRGRLMPAATMSR